MCSSHLLCMTAVPGVRENDFDLEDGFEGSSTAKQPRKSIEKLQRNRPPIGPRSYSYGSGSEMRPTAPGRKASSQEIPSSDQSGIRTIFFFFYVPSTVSGSDDTAFHLCLSCAVLTTLG